MYKISDIRSVHLEVTSKCQARCPMCPRRIHGGPLNPFIELNEITLEQFKGWFPVEFIQQLNHLNMGGNLGDPIIAQDTLEIYQYLRQVNPGMTLAMNTNGSARTESWWVELAKIGVVVTFGIDGLKDTHHLYRVGTDWDKIINNATAFIQAGGDARWDMIVFQHNEHQVDACRELGNQLGFKGFYSKHTSRFTNGKFIAIDEKGFPTHTLYPTNKSNVMIPLIEKAKNETLPTIHCKAVASNQLYVGANGSVSPCGWLDLGWVPPMQENRIHYMDKIGKFPNLNSTSLSNIFEEGFFDSIKETWSTCGMLECASQCGSFDKVTAQYED